MDRLDSRQENCPLGQGQCPVLVEVDQLKQECRQLAEMSHTDSLTGLFNFRFLMQALGQEMERTHRTHLSTGLIMVDLDHFKGINDTYGHQAGNEALRWVSRILRENIRRIDIACRYGGEEFVIILPSTRLPQAVHVAERLRSVLAASPLAYEGRTINLTASFGVDVYKGREAASPEAFLNRVDCLLRQAKEEGRNCVRYEEGRLKKLPSQVTSDERAALFVGRWPKDRS